MNKWIKEQAVLWGLALLFVAAMPFLLAAYLLGFRQCWQCQKNTHILKMRRYWTWHDTKKPVHVCEACFEMLRESDEEGFV